MLMIQRVTALLALLVTVVATNVFGQEQCSVVCDTVNTTEFCDAKAAASAEKIKLKVLLGSWGYFLKPLAEEFGTVRDDIDVEVVQVSMSDMTKDIINEATSQTGLFDAFLTPPTTLGSVVEQQGWADMQPYIEESPERLADWLDVMVGYRKHMAQYQDQILMAPLDGDLLHLFYNREILEHFELDPPRTWEEYNNVARELHGKAYKDTEIVGSCVGRVKGCAGTYWANLVIGSMTQYQGTAQGHLFDSQAKDTMQALMGEPCEKALEYMEGQVISGHPDELKSCIPLNRESINAGECALHYNWGNTFATYLKEGSVLGGNKLGVAKTPGSTHVWDRDQKKMVKCNAEICPYATYYDDIGYVNHPHYLAFAGWGCAVNNYTSDTQKRAAFDLCQYMSSPAISNEWVAPNATHPTAGTDPFRTSHLDPDLYTAQGYESETTELYLASVKAGLDTDNVMVDHRFPQAGEIYQGLEGAFWDHLQGLKNFSLVGADLPAVRRQLCSRLDAEWTEMIRVRDENSGTNVPTLEAYQKLRGVYTVDVELNQLTTGMRAYGFGLAGIILLTAFVFGLWAHINRETHVVKAAQPFFLTIICLGAFIFGSAIFPMSIDDGIASDQACTRACNSIPWLLLLGWSILFAALYAKLRRVNLVIARAMAFKREAVTEKDVMTPFVVIFTLNVGVLLVWTLVDPLEWERVEKSETESYGTCSADGDSFVWKLCLALLAAINGTALILANVEAYKGRQINTDYGESSYIALAMASMLQVFLIGIPLLFLVNDDATARFFVYSSMSFIFSMSVLLLLFVPKIYRWVYPPSNINKASITTTSMAGNVGTMNGSMGGTNHGSTRITGLTASADEIELKNARHQLHELQRKVNDLNGILAQDGVEKTSEYFTKAGLRVTEISEIDGGSSVFGFSKLESVALESVAEEGESQATSRESMPSRESVPSVDSQEKFQQEPEAAKPVEDDPTSTGWTIAPNDTPAPAPAPTTTSFLGTDINTQKREGATTVSRLSMDDESEIVAPDQGEDRFDNVAKESAAAEAAPKAAMRQESIKPDVGAPVPRISEADEESTVPGSRTVGDSTVADSTVADSSVADHSVDESTLPGARDPTEEFESVADSTTA